MSQGAAVVIEDDEDVQHLLMTVLQQSGFEVRAAATGREGVELVREKDPVVVTLDLGLPDIDGNEVLRRIRESSACYVIMLTARTDEADILTALQTGADDYLTKPFRPRELRARVSALLRRPRVRNDGTDEAETRRQSAQPPGRPGSTLRHGGLVLDGESRTVTLHGSELSLTRSEFDLLRDLMGNAGVVRRKDELVRIARGDSQHGDSYVSDFDERAIEGHIGNLRRKLREDARSPQWLLTVRGVGYRFATPKPGQQ